MTQSRHSLARVIHSRVLAWTLLLISAIVSAQAHPGHGLLDHGVAHLAASPFHALVLTAFGAGAFALAQALRHATARRCLRITGAVSLALAAALWIA